MSQSESGTCSFVVKVWIETGNGESGKTKWRGHITHVPSGERRYVKDPNDISFFILNYLAAMGVRVNPLWRLRRWIRKVATHLSGRELMRRG